MPSPLLHKQHTELLTMGSTTFMVKARPHAKGTRLRGPLGSDVFKVDIAAAPEDGKANEELIEFFSEEFDVHRSQVEILSGHTSKQKVIKIVRQ